jgi:transcriptional regulator with XRE-family HTH domain
MPVRSHRDLPRARGRRDRNPAVTLRQRIGAAIREQRLRREWTQGQLAEAVDLSLKYMGEIERGESNTTIETLEVLSRVLQWDVAEALKLPPPSTVKGVRLVLRSELKHLTDAINLILDELEPLAQG